jgi:hypothetical protein
MFPPLILRENGILFAWLCQGGEGFPIPVDFGIDDKHFWFIRLKRTWFPEGIPLSRSQAPAWERTWVESSCFPILIGLMPIRIHKALNCKGEPWFALQLGANTRFAPKKNYTFEALAKLPIDNNCHSERSEESRIFRRLRSFTSFRMTKKMNFARGSFDCELV